MKYIALLLLTVALVACSKSKPEPPPPEEFLTLADVSGRPTLVEDSPDVRVIQVKTKSFVKQNDLRAAKTKAVELATVVAVDEMVRGQGRRSVRSGRCSTPWHQPCADAV